MTEETWTVMRTLDWTAGAFRKRGYSSARLEAEVLLAHVLELERIGLYTQFDRPLTRGEREDYKQLVRRRFAGEPSQYIVGEQEFWSIPLAVNSSVLVPRPDTEILVEEALRAAAGFAGGLRMLDVGTGSGAIALALRSELSDSDVWACDVSAEALALARQNGKKNALDVQWVHGSIEAFNGKKAFHVIVSNPPYIPTASLAGLMTEVRDHEPHLALDGGPDGLNVFRQILDCAPPLLHSRGWLGFEVEGERQANEVLELFRVSGEWDLPEVRKDYAGIPRVVYSRRVN